MAQGGWSRHKHCWNQSLIHKSLYKLTFSSHRQCLWVIRPKSQTIFSESYQILLQITYLCSGGKSIHCLWFYSQPGSRYWHCANLASFLAHFCYDNCAHKYEVYWLFLAGDLLGLVSQLFFRLLPSCLSRLDFFSTYVKNPVTYLIHRLWTGFRLLWGVNPN